MHVGEHSVLELEPDTDPRPLYFIPYDPDVHQTQEERAFGRRVLFSRIHSAIISVVGRAHPPVEVILETQRLLNDALFGMYGHWENLESDRHMRRLCRDFVRKLADAVNAETSEAIDFLPRQGWRISLDHEEQQQRVLRVLTQFSSEALDFRAEPQPTLFDETEQ